MESKVGREGLERTFLGAHRVKILLVDEDKEDLAYYQLILRQAGCQVHARSSYGEALSCLTSEQFDLVIVEQGSPGFQGKTILQRAIEIDRHLPVLVLTRCLDVGCYLEAMQLGAVDYLEEPIKVSDLIYTLETHLGTLAPPRLDLKAKHWAESR